MIIANISIDDEQVTSFIFENEGSLSLELNGNAELTDLEQQVIEKYANEIARIVRN